MKGQWEAKGIAVLFLKPRRLGGWVVNSTPWPLYPLEWPATHCMRG